jgi:hypothetical protein
MLLLGTLQLYQLQSRGGCCHNFLVVALFDNTACRPLSADFMLLIRFQFNYVPGGALPLQRTEILLSL